MNSTKHRAPSVIDSASDPMSTTGLDRALSRVAVELSADDAAALRWEPPNSTASNLSGFDSGARSATPRNGPGGTISDTCNFYMTATSFSEPRIRDPLDALDPTFRKIVSWKKRGVDLNGATDAMVFMKRPSREFAAGSGLRFVAVDPDTYQGKAVLDRATHQEFWSVQMNGRPFSMEFLKSGAAIWKKLGIKVEPETTAYMMQMSSVDAETSEAIQSALWSAFNTAQGPIDFETAVFVLAAFIHADPLRKRFVADDSFVHPYGDRTAYGLGRFYEDGDDWDTKPNQAGLPPHSRYLPIEADSELRQKIEADPTINPDHMDALNALKLLLASDAEKTRVFCGTLRPWSQAILDDVLEVAINEIEVEHATVVGVVSAMIMRMIDICSELRVASAP